MTNRQSAAREHRVTLALKWAHLDGCSVDEIQDRFIENGYGEYAHSTIQEYLREKPSEAVHEQIENEHADVRLRIIDRHERKHDRARQAEREVTDRQEVIALRPESTVNQRDSPIQVPDWRVLDTEEHPPEATNHDKRITFLDDETRTIRPGESYYVSDPDGDPVYEEFVAAVEEVPDDKQQSFLRREQSHHLEQQGEAAGVYEEDINVNMSGGVDHSVELDSETAAAIRQADLGSDADE